MTFNILKISVLTASTLIIFSCNNSSTKVEKTEVKSTITEETKSATTSNSEMVSALFNNDSLLVNYNYSKEIDEKIRRKERSLIANRESKMKDFQNLYQTLNQKAPTMTQLEAQQAEQQLMQKQQELDAEDQQVQQKYIDWKTNILLSYQAHLDSTLENFRIENDIDLLIPSGGGITKFYYSSSLDVTNKVVDYLNLHYAKKEDI